MTTTKAMKSHIIKMSILSNSNEELTGSTINSQNFENLTKNYNMPLLNEIFAK